MNPLPTFHVLALSGGGYRSFFTATVLQQLEETLGRPIAEQFDLICGTSAGGLLALGLAAEIPAAELRELFQQQGNRIFNSQNLMRRTIGKWFSAKHSGTGLREVLTGRFGAQKIGDLRHRVLVPAVNYSTGKGQFFKTPHHPTFERDHRTSIVDVCMATSAAPVYFPLSRNSRGVFVDGGLIGNAPGFFGLHEVRTFLASPELSCAIRVLSIGTLSVGPTIRGNENLDKGIVQWGSSLFDLVISAQESSVDYMLRQSLGANYLLIDGSPTPEQSLDVKYLDQVTLASTTTLHDRAMHAAQIAIGDARFTPFRAHVAARPTFFHGPNKNDEVPPC